jgi:hypothetical protein
VEKNGTGYGEGRTVARVLGEPVGIGGSKYCLGKWKNEV